MRNDLAQGNIKLNQASVHLALGTNKILFVTEGTKMLNLSSLFNTYNRINKPSYVEYINVPAPSNTWTTVTTHLPRVGFYFASRPAKRWKK